MSGERPGDPRFYRRAGPFTLAEILAAGGLTAPEGADPARRFSGVAALQHAGPEEVSFLDNRRYVPELRATRAGAVILHPDLRDACPAETLPLLTETPYLAWARIAALFFPPTSPLPGIDARAAVDPSAKLGEGVEVGPFAVIGAGAEIGPRTRIGAGTVIGPGVVIGADCRIGPQVTISHALIGDRVVIHPGARIGQDGFGFAITAEGFVSVPQLGRVIIEDDADIGANTTIDRGSAADTVIGRGSRLDNLVQIGHNVRLGRYCVVAAQAGISGSTVVGDFVMMGGQAGLVGHLRIGERARIGAQAGVMSDVPAGSDVLGSPAQPVRAFFRQVAALKRLAGRRPGKEAGKNGENAPASRGEAKEAD
jgi:UDP-3-O-[3-hydroxymyristoyl] glucosamine N-acyltransferase